MRDGLSRLCIGEKRIGKRYGAHRVQVVILIDRRIDKELDRHVDFFARLKRLAGETETLDLVEIGPGGSRRHVEDRGSDRL